MKLQSWNRFKTRALAVEPGLMGNTTSFVHHSSTVTIKIPALERVGDSHDEDALATRGAWNSKTGETLYFDIRAVDVITVCQSEVALSDAVLTKHPNAYELIDKGTQTVLNSIAGTAAVLASSAFEYWISLLRWVTGFHRIGREVRVGSESGWSTYLHDSATEKPVWIEGQTIVVQGVHAVTADQWQRVHSHALAGDEPPMHIVLLNDAKHCTDVGDYRRALVDLSIACEVYLRTVVINSLPSGVLEEAIRLIEEANINQFVAHLFPALLSNATRQDYKETVKDDLSSLFSRRNKLMHVAALEGTNRETCERFQCAVEALFSLEHRSKA